MSTTTAAGAASNAMTLFEQMTDVIANNLANVDTPGFQAIVMNVMSGASNTVLRASDEGVTPVGTVAGMPETVAESVDTRPGAMTSTGNPLDLMLEGPGYWVIGAPSGAALTRDGSFRLDGTGRIVTASGDTVLGTNGPIIVPQGARAITVGADGTVTADGLAVGQLRIAAAPDAGSLTPLGGALYQTTAPITPSATPPRVVQGSLEMSNVSSVQEMVHLITVLRVYQQFAQALNIDDSTKNLASQSVGQVS